MKTDISSILGPTTQLGFVVPDVEAAMRHWIDVFGVGPFLFLPNGVGRPASTTFHHGQATMVETRLAFAFMGDVQIELIEQTNEASSPYRDFLAAGNEGLQHLGFWVEDHALACERVEAAGYRREYEIPVAGQDRPIIYYRPPSGQGPMLELVPPVWRRSRAAVKAHLAAYEGPGAISTFDTYGAFLAHAGVRFD